MSKSKLIPCKTCGAEIAKSAKSCPHCGAKNKKPFFKKLWFWVMVIILLCILVNSKSSVTRKNTANHYAEPSQSALTVDTKQKMETIAQESVKSEPETLQAEETVPEESILSTGSHTGIDPEFKAAMDAYESFYAEYCELLKKYTANPTDLTLLAKYADMMSKAEQMDAAFEAWNEDDLNSEELKYYLDVNNRVLKMLVDITG